MLNNISKYVRLFPFVLSNYRPSYPKQIDIELTNRCNLKCDMCWFHGTEGIGDRYKGKELTTSELCKLISQFADYRPQIYLGGCEPFVRVDFLPVLEHIKDLNLSATFTTNGTLLDSDKIGEIVNLGVDQIIFSIDGNEEIHDQIRGKGVFRKVTSNIKELAKYRMGKNKKKPVIFINITITPLVIGRLQKSLEAIREATSDSVDYYRIHHLWFITSKELTLHQTKIKKYLNCSARGAACHLTPLSANIDQLTLSREIMGLKNYPQIRFFPNLDSRDLHNYYFEGIHAKFRCVAPFYSAIIKPNGDVKFCPDEWIDDYILGNIREEAFENIWNNKMARHFRSVIFWHRSFLGCKRCSWMYSF
jgi:radical SAM protein with 4Fe4S-binding SPASM domain